MAREALQPGMREPCFLKKAASSSLLKRPSLLVSNSFIRARFNSSSGKGAGLGLTDTNVNQGILVLINTQHRYSELSLCRFRCSTTIYNCGVSFIWQSWKDIQLVRACLLH
ncbi:hypothetical protein Ancab_030131 [Ancistrocladus abbreviatus]